MRALSIEGVGFADHVPVHSDARGFLQEIWRLGSSCWTNQLASMSVAGVLRGMHFQTTQPQAKIVTVLHGTIFDAVIDLRPHSLTYRQWFGAQISGGSGRAICVPVGMAHGFYVMEGPAVVVYWCSSPFDPAGQGGIRWDDPTVAIEWPLDGGIPMVSERDSQLPYL